MKRIWDFVSNRLKEPSTWRGVTVALTAVGVDISPEQTSAIITAGVAIFVAIEVFKKDAKSADAK